MSEQKQKGITRETLKFVFKTAWKERPSVFLVYLMKFISEFASKMQNEIMAKLIIDELVLMITGAEFAQHLANAAIFAGLYIVIQVQLEFQPEALAAMADVTLERKTGARGLRSVFEATLKELMFQIPSDSTVEKVTITPETVRSGAEPIILRNPKKESHDLTAGALKNA